MRELLFLLCRYPFDETNREPLSKLTGEVRDWHEMVELINAHGIIALAAYNIKEAGLEKKIPEDAMAILENGYLQSMVRNAWLTERWKEVNTILGNAGIKHVLLKGMALEHTIYDAKGLRQMNDNDVLVKRDDSLKAWYLLQQEGFSHGLIKSPLHKKIMVDIGKHLPTLYKNGYAIEIHHKLFDTKTAGEIGYSDPFDDAVEIFIGDTKASILPKEIQQKYLINHFERHALEGNCQLRLYSDIMLLDKTGTIKIPDHFISNPKQEIKKEHRKAAYIANISSIPVRQRFRYIIGDIFPSVKWMKERYKCTGIKALFYYPLRIGKLMWLL
ncbi:MAG: nucleotidyltransferase family protein [Bacteroidia bacterium]|nr:nucleotidyltransferase family protein [Bacteroidia bacterium]